MAGGRRVAVLALLLALLLAVAEGFTFLGKIKMPRFKSSEEKALLQAAEAKYSDKAICVITGTSSGLGKQTAKALLKTGRYHVIGCVRDLDKMAAVVEEEFIGAESLQSASTDFTAIKCDLNSFASVREAAQAIEKVRMGRPLDRLVCNAALYQPLAEPQWSKDGHEQQMQTNFLSQFLLTSLLVPQLKEASSPRVIMVGSITGNDNTVGGGGVYPIADLRELEGLQEGGKMPIAMMDGRNFNGAKAYKDSKLAIMMSANLLHEKFNKMTGISFSSIYPGCIAESPLFREKPAWFRKYFPIFMKYITGGYVSEPEAGQRLYQVIVDPRCSRSGVYWSWNGGPRMGRGNEALKNDGNIIGAGGAGGGWDSIYENDQSDKVRDAEKAAQLFALANKVTGAEWPVAKASVSPCPTLRVISAVTAVLDKLENNQRKRAAPKTMRELMGAMA